LKQEIRPITDRLVTAGRCDNSLHVVPGVSEPERPQADGRLGVLWDRDVKSPSDSPIV